MDKLYRVCKRNFFSEGFAIPYELLIEAFCCLYHHLSLPEFLIYKSGVDINL